MSIPTTIKGRAKPRQLSIAHGLKDTDFDDTQIVLALARGLEVLGAFRRADAGLGNAQIAERTGMTKPTVSRFTYTLVKYGYLHFDPRSRLYRLGIKALTLGAVAQATTDIRAEALPLMRELACGSRFNVGLGTRDAHQMIYIDTCEGDALVGLRLFPGSRVPIATSAMGRAYLASLDQTERATLMSELRPRYDDEWSSVMKGVEQACDDLARAGFCLSLGDWQKDIHGAAAPIKAVAGQPTYVVNLGGPAYALLETDLRDTLGPQLVDLVRRLETTLGIDEA